MTQKTTNSAKTTSQKAGALKDLLSQNMDSTSKENANGIANIIALLL